MQAALEATARGHQVILCEAGEKLGALKFADNDCWFKEPMRRWREYQIAKVLRSGAEVRLNTMVTKELVTEVNPDVLIIAVGGEPFAIPVPGADGSNVVFGAYLTPQTKIGKNVVIIGGGFIGCEEAIDLAHKGHEVTILEMLDDLASECGRMHRLGLIHELENEHIHKAVGMRCTKIDISGVYAMNKEGKEIFYPCDTVVMASGMRSRSTQVSALQGLVGETYVIGDARKASKIMNATRDAYDAVTALGYM
ncbi:MAG: NAD(P)/FAD-dependent oxidoreductase [Oscillospiraceae bacterium]|nr:NAD(P)/FAD-dependent oxidoreductase [Oscillospiraceae bacterium]